MSANDAVAARFTLLFYNATCPRRALFRFVEITVASVTCVLFVCFCIVTEDSMYNGLFFIPDLSVE